MAENYTQILRQGTYSQYVALTSKDANLLYFCTDNGKLFKGSVDFTNNFVSVTANNLPETGVPGKIYYVSDQAKFKTWIGTGYVEIGNAIDAVGTSTSTTITASSVDDHVPSSKNVYLYGQEILSQAIGGAGIVKTIEAGEDDATITVVNGDNSTYDVTVPGVGTGLAAGSNAATISLSKSTGDADSVTVPGVITAAEAGENAGEIDFTNSTSASSNTVVVPGVAASIVNKTSTDAAFTVTPTTGDAYDVVVSGVVTTPTWNSTNRILTLPVAGSSSVEVNIGKDLVLESGRYDTSTKEIVLVLNDEAETEIRISVADLIDIYTGGSTTTATVTVSSSNVITSNVKLGEETDNDIIVSAGTNGGLYSKKYSGVDGTAVNVAVNSTTHAISATVNVADNEGNGLTIEDDGLFVDVSGFAQDEDLSALATATTSWGSFT